MNELHTALIIAVTAGVTILLRFLPFLIFSGGRKTPAIVERLGRALPAAVMAMLVVYCLRNVEFSAPAGWAPALIGVMVTAGLHVWRRSTLLSIVGGTVVHMLLVQLVF